MPQMAPFSDFLYLFFLLILMFTAFNYSIKTPIKISRALKTTQGHKLTWKW